MATDLGSLLGSLLGGGSGGSGGAGGEGGRSGNVLAALLGALGAPGGQGGGSPLQGLLQQLNEGGLAGKTESWVGTGRNEPLSGPEVAQALPYQVLENVAQQSGVSPEQAADQLATAIPDVVDKLTPDGSVPQGGSLEELIRQRL